MHRQSRMAERLKVAAASSNASRARGTVAVHPNRLADLQRAIGNQAVKGLTDSIGLASGIYSDVLRSPGQPLPPAVQADMEGWFDQDFSNVQIHLGEEAERSAAEMSANAYSVGRHIVFAPGRYAPETNAGKELLAHELAHVVQQSRGGLAPPTGAEGAIEQDAHQAAIAAARGDGAVQVNEASGVGIARQDSSFDERVRRELHDALLRDLFASQSSTSGGGDAPQANQPLTSLLNGPFFAGNNPVGTLSTDVFSTPLVFQSSTDPSVGATYLPSFTLQVRDRTSPEDEWGVFASLGGVSPLGTPRSPTTGLPPLGGGPSATTTGALGLSYHHGPEAPSDEARYVFGRGFWLTAGQSWGLQPPVSGSVAPPGWSFNPTANAMLSLGWARAKHGEADLIFGVGLSRWGQVNGVPVGGFLAPYAGFSYTWNLGDADSIYAEALAGTNLGLAGRFDAGTGFPLSLSAAGGIGYQHTWGDYGVSVEPWVFAEPWSTVSTPAQEGFPAGPGSNIGGGLRFNLTSINPRRRRYLSDE